MNDREDRRVGREDRRVGREDRRQDRRTKERLKSLRERLSDEENNQIKAIIKNDSPEYRRADLLHFAVTYFLRQYANGKVTLPDK